MEGVLVLLQELVVSAEAGAVQILVPQQVPLVYPTQAVVEVEGGTTLQERVVQVAPELSSSCMI